MNARDLHEKLISDASWVHQLAESELQPAEIVENVYLAVYSRRPVEEELQIALDLYENTETSRRAVTEDLLWALLNTPEFVFED